MTEHDARKAITDVFLQWTGQEWRAWPATALVTLTDALTNTVLQAYHRGALDAIEQVKARLGSAI